MAVLTAALSGMLGILAGAIGAVIVDRVSGGEAVGEPSGSGDGSRPWSAGLVEIHRLPLVSATAALFVLTGWLFASADPPDYWAVPGMLLFVWMLLVVAVVDYRTRRIPNALTYPLTPTLFGLLATAAMLNRTPARAGDLLVGGIGAFAFLFVLALINPRGMGMGDVKYAAFLGIGLGYLGIGTVVVGILAAFFIGSVVSLGLVVTRTRSRKDTIPFGPFLSAGALVALVTGPSLVRAYLRSAGLA